MPRRTLTSDGFERTFAVNHLAPVLLTNLLLDRLTASAPARVVNVASTMHRRAHIDFDDLNGERRYGVMRAYGRSRLANVLFTRSLARRHAGTGVVANALHPGAVFPGSRSGVVRSALAKLALLFMLTPEEGAQTSLYLATSPDVADVSGLYFVKCKPVEPSLEGLDDGIADHLWQISAQLTGLAPAQSS